MTKEDINKISSESKYIDSDNMIQPQPIITIKDKVILTSGNFITISGLPKARKTTFMQYFIASCLNNQSYFGIKANLNKNDKICLIDTEQGIYDFYKQNKFLKKALGKNTLPKNFSAYLFREYNPDVILNSIYSICENEKPKVIFIDNLTELCLNINDLLEAKKVVQFLKMITAKFDIAIVCLLHLNKGNGFSVGSLGSISDRGAQSCLKVVLDKESDVSTLECSMLRSDAHFEPISIKYDCDLNTYTDSENPSTTTTKKAKFSMSNYTEQELLARLDIVFEMQKTYTYSSLVENLKNVFGVGNNSIKQVVIPYIIFKKYITNKDKIYNYYKN